MNEHTNLPTPPSPYAAATPTAPPAPPGPRGQRRAGWLVLAGLALYLSEFIGMAIAGGYPGNEPGTAPDLVGAAYAGLAEGSGFLVGWMALVLTGRILILVGLRQLLTDRATGDRGSALLDWAVAAMTVSVALEVASVAATAAAAGLVADGVDPAAVIAVDRIAWFLGVGVTAPGGLAALLVAVAMWRHRGFGTVLPAAGVLIGAVMLAGGLLSGAPSTYPIASLLSIGVLVWWLWVLAAGIIALRGSRREPTRTLG